MKVLHVIASVDPRGGGPIEGVLSSAKVWFEHGHECHILSLDSPDASWVGNALVPTFTVGLRGPWYQAIRRQIPWLRYGYTPHLKSWLEAHASNYDAIIINGLWTYASYGTWRALSELNVPYFVYPHGTLDPWFNQAYPKKHILKNIFWKLFESKVLRDARGVFFTAEEERRLASTSFSPFGCRSYVVGYGAQDVPGNPEEQRAAFLSKVPATNGRRLILFLSRIHPKKGVDLLIKSFARLAREFRDIDLVIAGPDQVGLKPQYMEIARELGIAERIHWPGMLSGNEKWGAFRSAEFLALPSHQENFGVVIVEAMAVAKPVLITNKVNIWREVQSDGAGHVVNDNLAGISDGLKYMCTLSRPDLEIMGRRARQSFEKRYDLGNNATSLLKLIERLALPDGNFQHVPTTTMDLKR